MRRRLLAWLLHHANANPSVYARQFYELKDRLLRKYGTRAGEDVQLITKPCYGESIGYLEWEGCKGYLCRRCGGSGVFSRRMWLLERWEFAGRIFHRPDREVYGDGWRVTIEGRIEHHRNYRASKDALLWLALLCDRGLFLRMFGNSRLYGWTVRPMVLLHNTAWYVRLAVARVTPKHCHCGRSWLPLFQGTGWCVCPRCSPRDWRGRSLPRPAFVGGDDDLPF